MEPLAARLRPEHLDDVFGQEQLTGAGKPLRVAVEKKHLFSFILWGPPGSGKTTLARIYAHALDAALFELSAVSAGKEDIRKIVAADTGGKPKVLFLDEIHRFTKAQQDSLLPLVEDGSLTLIGATTENPSFEVIAPLLSRCRVFVLNPLPDEALGAVLARSGMKVAQKARDWLVAFAQGDARKALGVLETTRELYGSITVKNLEAALESPYLRYDKKGEEHYDTISAFIKSMRASQGDATLYYLARMVAAGEDPLFIARRMVIFASEDVGLAQPTALVVANAVFQACQTIGYPECAINLAHGAAYLARAQKSRESYDAYFMALDDVKKQGNLPIPLKVRNAPTKLMKDLGYHKGYALYDTESYLPDKLKKQKRKYLHDNPETA